DEIVQSVIPQHIKAEADRFLSAFSFEVNSLAADLRTLIKRTERVNTQTSLMVEKVRNMEKRLERLEDHR
ncbi:MAG: hypothetical protein HY367_03940, partial [Candidatus Aenigmarchaeota archaeon]|nr:hypothetical protein [Candidatus Aenigmarchaeota archaeon]